MVVFFFIVLGSLSFVSGTRAEPIDVFANSLSLDTGTQLNGSNGTLIYRGGFVLTSPDARFGGLSGLVISSDGEELVAVSDRGWWLQARLGESVELYRQRILAGEVGGNFLERYRETLDAAVTTLGDRQTRTGLDEIIRRAFGPSR